MFEAIDAIGARHYQANCKGNTENANVLLPVNVKLRFKHSFASRNLKISDGLFVKSYKILENIG